MLFLLYSCGKGTYELNRSDSTMVMENRITVGAFPAWNVPGKDMIIKTRLKIVLLNEEKLELKSVPCGPANLPSPHIIEAYTAVHK